MKVHIVAVGKLKKRVCSRRCKRLLRAH